MTCAAITDFGRLRIVIDFHGRDQLWVMDCAAMALTSDVSSPGIHCYLRGLLGADGIMTHVMTTQPKCGHSTPFVPTVPIILEYWSLISHRKTCLMFSKFYQITTGTGTS